MKRTLLRVPTTSRISPSAALFLGTWLPVIVMLAIIARESTSTFSAANTSGWMRSAYEALGGPVTDLRWPSIEHNIRKCGHFLGYGTLGLSWLRAWLIVWAERLARRPAWMWRSYAVAMAVACTAVVASLDELHQSFLPDRAGVPSDVLLDCSGAAVLILIYSTFWIRRPWQGMVT